MSLELGGEVQVGEVSGRLSAGEGSIGMGMARPVRAGVKREGEERPRAKPWSTPPFKGWVREHQEVYP